jgi:uncharacterized protein YxjI
MMPSASLQVFVIQPPTSATDMRFLLRNRFSALGDPFIIKDHESREAYQLTGRFHEPRERLLFSTVTGMELAYLHQHRVGRDADIEILIGGRSRGRVLRNSIWMGKRVRLDLSPNGYSIQGDLWGREYDLYNDRILVATISKRILNVPGAYGIEVTAWDYAVPALCTALAVDLAGWPERGE